MKTVHTLVEYESCFIKHAGIPGMRWGRRKRKMPTSISSTPGISKPKERRMTNKEITSRIKRLKMEKEYSDLTTVPKKVTVSKIEKLVKTAGTVAALSGSALSIYKNLDGISKMKMAGSKGV